MTRIQQILAIAIICLLATPQVSTHVVASKIGVPAAEFTGSAFVPAFAGFSFTGSMSEERQSPAAIKLNNGKVLIAGGWDGATCLASAELYDPTGGTWSATGSMHIGRCDHSMTLLQNGKVLVAGGNNGAQVSSAELYDPSNGTWSYTGSMGNVRDKHSATLLDDGEVLVAGGFNGSGTYKSSEVYDPGSGSWRPSSDMSYFRSRQSATLLDEGKVLVAGGEAATILDSAELYAPDPYPGMWSTTGSMGVPRVKQTATILVDGKVLVAGGFYNNTELDSAELYDPGLHSWSPTGSLTYPRKLHTATLLGNGKVLAIGGSNGDTYYDSTELYDPGTGFWSTTASLNAGRDEHAAAALNGSQVLVAGGYYSGTILSSAEIGTFLPANTFSGTLILPSGWLTSTNVGVNFVGTTSDASINAGALSSDNATWGEWIAAAPNVSTPATFDVGNDGTNEPIYLRLRDINNQITTVVSGTVDVDSTAPIAAVNPLSSTQTSLTFPVSWDGTDATSSIAVFDVQYRVGGGAWTDWITGTAAHAADFTGLELHSYSFRARARDVAGNWGSYSDGSVSTIVDTLPFDLYLPLIKK